MNTLARRLSSAAAANFAHGMTAGFFSETALLLLGRLLIID
jgi:hypothetical protein